MRRKIVCIGDLVGRAGRSALAQLLPGFVKSRQVDCVIVNAENAAGGSGLTRRIFEKLQHNGVHLVTLGDHVYRRREVVPLLEQSDRIVRPANLSAAAKGRQWAVYQAADGVGFAVTVVLGRLFMQPVDCPFAAVDRVLAAIPAEVKLRVVEIHGEATSEKVAMGWYLDGRVTAVVGTHTHVPTADERVLTKGTAYVTDLGMTGPYDSILGRRTERVLQAITTGMPTPFAVATGDPRVCGVLITADATTGLATNVERFCLCGAGSGQAYDEDDGKVVTADQMTG